MQGWSFSIGGPQKLPYMSNSKNGAALFTDLAGTCLVGICFWRDCINQIRRAPSGKLSYTRAQVLMLNKTATLGYDTSQYGMHSFTPVVQLLREMQVFGTRFQITWEVGLRNHEKSLRERLGWKSVHCFPKLEVLGILDFFGTLCLCVTTVGTLCVCVTKVYVINGPITNVWCSVKGYGGSK